MLGKAQNSSLVYFKLSYYFTYLNYKNSFLSTYGFANESHSCLDLNNNLTFTPYD